MADVNIFWFRRDLRLHDNAGLYHALKGELPVLPLFIFDRNILDQLEEKADARVQFIRDTLVTLQEELGRRGSGMEVLYGQPEEAFETVLSKYYVRGVFTNCDYEPYARQRDETIGKLLASRGISFHAFKDHVIFDRDEILKDDGTPYTVYTPYSKRWKAKVNAYYLRSYPVERYLGNLYQHAGGRVPSLASMGFKPSDMPIPPNEVHTETLKKYE
ncbi:MAG TPA: deoxyribodipyrimidine photo-lyase, partial [Puia sp.]